MRVFLVSSLAALNLSAAAPALAQSEATLPMQFAMAQDEAEPSAEEMEAALAAMGDIFAVDPLTAEQEARLPMANAIIQKIMPEGVMQEMMGSMFDGSFDKLMELGEENHAKQVIAESTGLSTYDLEMSDEEAEELASVFDPAWRERKEIEKALLPEMMGTMFSAMEPAMRKAMAELYAINFSDQELRDIDGFFSTESGANFARKSFTMASDKRIIAASMEALPAMMGSIATLDEKKQAAEADLPPARTYADLTASEKARVAQATGVSAEDLEAMASGDWDDDQWSEEEAMETIEDAVDDTA